MAQRKWQRLARDCVRASGLGDQVRAPQVFVQITAADAAEFRCNLVFRIDC